MLRHPVQLDFKLLALTEFTTPLCFFHCKTCHIPKKKKTWMEACNDATHHKSECNTKIK